MFRRNRRKTRLAGNCKRKTIHKKQSQQVTCTKKREDKKVKKIVHLEQGFSTGEARRMLNAINCNTILCGAIKIPIHAASSGREVTVGLGLGPINTVFVRGHEYLPAYTNDKHSSAHLNLYTGLQYVVFIRPNI